MNVPIEAAFLEAYEQYADAIFRFCYFRVYDRERAKELMQDAYCRAWKYVADGNTINNLRAFLYATARNVIIDYHRKRQEDSLEQLQARGFEPAENPAELLALRMDVRQVIGVMRQLEEPYREALVLRYVDGLSPREIAHITGESANVISVRLHRGVAKLRALLLH